MDGGRGIFQGCNSKPRVGGGYPLPKANGEKIIDKYTYGMQGSGQGIAMGR